MSPQWERVAHLHAQHPLPRQWFAGPPVCARAGPLAVPEVVSEPGVPANAALVVAATLKVQLVGGLKQRVQLNRRRRRGRPLSAALALRAARVFAAALSFGFAFAPPLARGSGFALAHSRAIALLTSPLSFQAGRPASFLCHGC